MSRHLDEGGSLKGLTRSGWPTCRDQRAENDDTGCIKEAWKDLKNLVFITRSMAPNEKLEDRDAAT